MMFYAKNGLISKKAEVNSTLEQGAGMAKGVLAAFIEGINLIDFDEISVFGLSNSIRIHKKATLKIAHLTKLVDKYLNH